MKPEDREFLEDVYFWFYETRPSSMNREAGNVLAEMLVAVGEKSSALDWIPRAPGSAPGLVWLLSQVVQIAWRTNHDGNYTMAVRAVALQYRSIVAIALTCG
jgi:hypothetical protein